MRARHLAWPGAVDGQTAIKIARIRLSDGIGLALARRLIDTVAVSCGSPIRAPARASKSFSHDLKPRNLITRPEIPIRESRLQTSTTRAARGVAGGHRGPS